MIVFSDYTPANFIYIDLMIWFFDFFKRIARFGWRSLFSKYVSIFSIKFYIANVNINVHCIFFLYQMWEQREN